MFYQITMVTLSDADHLYDYRLPWPAKSSHEFPELSDFERLRYAGVIPGSTSISDSIIKEGDKKNLIVPVHYNISSSGGAVQQIGDLSEQHYKELGQTLQEVIGQLESHSRAQVWQTAKQYTRHDLNDRLDLQEASSMQLRQKLK